MTDPVVIWSYLAQEPLVWLTLTLVAYSPRRQGGAGGGAQPLANAVLIAVILLGSMLWITETPYPVYFEGAKFVHFLLGPATVALAVPLYAQGARLRRAILPVAGRVAASGLSSR